MMTETEWKLFSQLRKVALERYCERTLAELQYVMTDPAQTAHERFLALWKTLNERNEMLATAFDNPRRSAAQMQLILIDKLQLLTDQELAEFREETRQLLERNRSL